MFGSIVNEGYLNSNSGGEKFCIYNRNPSACSYGVAVGVLAFLTCLLYLALDAYFPQISSVKDRKKAVLSDIGVSGESPWPWGRGEGTDSGSRGWQQGVVGPGLGLRPWDGPRLHSREGTGLPALQAFSLSPPLVEPR